MAIIFTSLLFRIQSTYSSWLCLSICAVTQTLNLGHFPYRASTLKLGPAVRVCGEERSYQDITLRDNCHPILPIAIVCSQFSQLDRGQAGKLSRAHRSHILYKVYSQKANRQLKLWLQGRYPTTRVDLPPPYQPIYLTIPLYLHHLPTPTESIGTSSVCSNSEKRRKPPKATGYQTPFLCHPTGSCLLSKAEDPVLAQATTGYRTTLSSTCCCSDRCERCAPAMGFVHKTNRLLDNMSSQLDRPFKCSWEKPHCSKVTTIHPDPSSCCLAAATPRFS